jgi:hypothetical protein
MAPAPLRPPPDVFEPARGKRGIARRRIDRPMTQIGLQRSRIQALICQRVAAGMPKHVRVYLKTDLGFLAGARQQLGKSRGGERTAPFGGKHEGRSRLALETLLAPVIHR